MGACGRSPVWALAGVLLALPGCASGDASTESCASNLGCDGRTQRGYQSAQEDDWREPDEGELEQALLRDRATSRGCTRYSAEDTAALAGGTIALDDQPFIISDPDALLASPAGDMLARGALLRKYGTHRLSWSSSRANAGNVRERTGPLRYFVQEVMRGEQSRDFRAFSSEWFLDPRHKAMAEATSIRLHALAARATGDTAFLDQEPQDQFMSIGANGSSVSFHGHGPALFGLYVGMKRFYLVPPTEPQPRVEGGVDFFELDSWLAMVRGLPDRDKAAATAALRSCILQPGDMIFIPDGWWHATKDLTETVGTTALFSQGFPGGVGLVSDDGIEAEELGGALPPTFDDAADCEIYFDEPECLADRSTAGDAEPCEWHSEIGLCTTLGMSVPCERLYSAEKCTKSSDCTWHEIVGSCWPMHDLPPCDLISHEAGCTASRGSESLGGTADARCVWVPDLHSCLDPLLDDIPCSVRREAACNDPAGGCTWDRAFACCVNAGDFAPVPCPEHADQAGCVKEEGCAWNDALGSCDFYTKVYRQQ